MMSALLKFNRQFKKIVRPCLVQSRFQQTQIKHKPNISASSSDLLPVYKRAINFSDRLALRDDIGSYTYGNLLVSANELSNEILKNLRGNANEQILFLCPNDSNYVITQWAIWIAGQTAVPVHVQHPRSMIEYYVRDCNAQLLVTTPAHAEMMHQVSKACGKTLLVLDEKLQESCFQNVVKSSTLENSNQNNFSLKKNALIIYTSGTTGNPKGVVLTHKNVISQVNSLVDAWRWTCNDTILHTLPLHHIHGIVNALLCPLHIGAKCNMIKNFDSSEVWSHLLGINSKAGDRKVSVFMAVPTIYSKLIDEYERIFSKDAKMSEYIKTTLKSKMRLMVSGSAPLPAPVYEKWFNITGHRILERYGTTEIGMCLSQEFDSTREVGYVGVPLPGVTVRLGQAPENNEGDYTTLLECSNINSNVQLKLNKALTFTEDPVGELLVKGDNLFQEYYNKPDSSDTAFTVGRWFKTGDTCQFSLDKKIFKILGRTSVDVIKTGGYKVSALEIESKLLAHPDITDCAVVGLFDKTWGEVIAAVITVRENAPELNLQVLKPWAKENMTSYTIPKVLKIVNSIPKNAMGKVNKKELVINLFSAPS